MLLTYESSPSAVAAAESLPPAPAGRPARLLARFVHEEVNTPSHHWHSI